MIRSYLKRKMSLHKATPGSQTEWRVCPTGASRQYSVSMAPDRAVTRTSRIETWVVTLMALLNALSSRSLFLFFRREVFEKENSPEEHTLREVLSENYRRAVGRTFSQNSSR